MVNGEAAVTFYRANPDGTPGAVLVSGQTPEAMSLQGDAAVRTVWPSAEGTPRVLRAAAPVYQLRFLNVWLVRATTGASRWAPLAEDALVVDVVWASLVRATQTTHRFSGAAVDNWRLDASDSQRWFAEALQVTASSLTINPT